MRGQVAAPAVAAALGAPAPEAPVSGAARPGGAAFAIVPLRAVYPPEAAPGSAEPERGYKSPASLVLDITGRLERNRERETRPIRFEVAGSAPGDAVLATRRAVTARGAPPRAGVAPERIAPPDPDPVLAPPPRGSHRPEVVPARGRFDPPPWSRRARSRHGGKSGLRRAGLTSCPTAAAHDARGCPPR